MRGALRFAIVFAAAGLALGPIGASAQDAPPANNAPASNAVGPRELQNFSLQGNVTRLADQPAQQPAAPRSTTNRAEAAAPAPAREHARARTQALAAPRRAETTPPQAQPAPSTSDFAQSQPLPTAPAAAAAPSTGPAASTFPEPAESATGTLAPRHGLPIWPWLLAALMLAGAGALLVWRTRSHRMAVAGAPQLDLFAAPESAPVPPPAPAPPAVRPAPPAAPLGIVSSNLRPWLEINVRPLRCIVTDASVTIEFELELFNSGSAPARGIHIAAAVINAGEAQDQQLANFFGQSAGPGERIEVIQPLKRVGFTTQIVASLEQIQALEVGGRRVFVPILAFNAVYARGSNEGQTSVGYLVGREGKGDKLAPFRLDLGPRIFRGLGARPLPAGVRK